MPLNDPFGGWVYWSRLPQAAIDRVEIVRGAASDLYGADAVGGVIQVVPADVRRTRAPDVARGRIARHVARVGVSARRGRLPATAPGFGIGVGAERFVDRRRPIIAEDVRGPIDTPAGVGRRRGW